MTHTIMFIALLSLALAQTSPSPSGQTLDLCTDSSDCVPPRNCLQSTIPKQCSSDPTAPSCLRCIPAEGLQACTIIADCPSNESCFANPNLPLLVCMSSAEGPLTGAKEVGHSDQSRVTLDVCSIDRDCAGERFCKFLSPGITDSCENRTTCKCLTSHPIECDTSDMCDPGEVCARTTGLGNICVSEIVASEAGVPPAEESDGTPPGPDTPILSAPNQPTSPPSTDIPIVAPTNATTTPPAITESPSEDASEETPEETPEETSNGSLKEPIPSDRPGPPPSGNGTNLVLENCISDADCLAPRKCLIVSNATVGNNSTCRSSAPCACGFESIPSCKSDGECAPGEVCSLAGGVPFETCISQAIIDESFEESTPLPETQMTPESSPEMSEEPKEEEGACMDAGLLSHLSQNELVFRTHRRARVLCDQFGSCATAGHMVKHFGRAMMMRRYCAHVGCVARLMMVNSPRRRRGMMVSSHTKGLVLTSFAARYATSFEEAILRILIKVNL